MKFGLGDPIRGGMPDGFLFHDAAERQRLIDLSMRLRPTYLVAVALLLVPVLLGIPVFGVAFAAPILAAGALYVALDRRLPTARRPELLLLANCAAGILGTLLAAWFADGPKEYLFALPVFPMLAMATMFTRRVSMTAAVLTSFGIVTVGVSTYGEQVAAMPPMLILPVLLVLVSTLGAMASRNAEHVNRSTAVVDPLTGLLNRVALQTRATELEMHAAATSGRIGLIVADVDHFKRVNDDHGHATGDAVLVAVAERMRQELGTAGALFRFGGEEFVVLLQGATDEAATRWAERLRDAVGFMPVDGIAITASFGVAVSSAEQGFAYHDLFAEADRALLLAKRTGRDRVCSSSAPEAAGAGPVADPPAGSAASAGSADRRVTDLSVPDPAPTASDPGWDVRHAGGGDGNWLVRGAVDRAHIVDLLERCRRESDVNSLILLGGLIVCGFWLEWWLLIPSILTGFVWNLCHTKLPEVRRPEFAALAGLVLIVVASVGSAFLADPLLLFGLPMGSFVVFGACAAFNRAGASVIASVALVTTTATALLVDLGAVIATPFILAFPLALICASAVLGQALGRAGRENRVAGITDTLTGTLNRSALEARIPQLRQHAGVTGAPTSLLLFDIDHFKQVNDVHGHDTGDAVLAAVAYRLRSALRAFDSVYRVGGEEFLIVLVDTPHAEALAIAERARRTVAEHAPAGLVVTVSGGVATAQEGVPFTYDEVFGLADERLYAAKAGGRDMVVGAVDPMPHRELVAA